MADPLKMAAWTPNRTTDVVFDTPETVIYQKAIGVSREGFDINPTVDPDLTYNVERLLSGFWILKPYNDEFSRSVLTADFGTLRLSNWVYGSNMEEIRKWRDPTELPGISSGPDVAAENDYWIRKRVVSSGTYNQNVLDQNRTGICVDGADDIMDLDRVLVYGASSVPFEAIHEDQGYLIRWTLFDRPDGPLNTLFVFYFGGKLNPAHGDGQYALMIGGTGIAKLFEDDGTGAGSYVQRNEWRYCQAEFAATGTHALRILPHAVQYIEFRHQTSEIAKVSPSLVGTYYHESDATPGFLFRVQTEHRHAGYQAGHVTGAGYPELDMRRDLRCDVQINLLRYTTGDAGQGRVRDQLIDLGTNLSASPLIEVFPRGYLHAYSGDSPLTTITTNLWDWDGEVLISATSETYTDPFTLATKTRTGYAPPSPRARVQVELVLKTTLDYATPAVRSYLLHRAAVVGTQVPTPTPYTGLATTHIRDVNLMGQEGQEMGHDTARIALIDRLNEFPGLRQHTLQPVKVRTTHDDGTATKINLWSGYVVKTVATKKGILREAVDLGVNSAFKNWMNLDVSCRGKWLRLTEIKTQNFPFFYNASTGPEGATAPRDPVSGQYKAWKFSDILRMSLIWAGFTASQIDVPDVDQRPFPMSEEDIKKLHPHPWTTLADLLSFFVTYYMGGYLVWDANANSGVGMWRYKTFPTGNEDILWDFVTTPSTTGLPHRLGSYPARTSPVKRDSYSEYVVPPEMNLLWVFGIDKDGKLVKRGGYNPYSHQFSTTDGITPDPTDPDYIGRPIEVAINLDMAYSQRAVDWTWRRIAEIAMRGFKIVNLTSHLPLVEPGRAALASPDPYYAAGVYRPLQFGDFVRLDGVRYMARGVNPAYKHDKMQLANVELQEWRTPIAFKP